MQSHPEDPGTISATQAFSPSVRVKSRVAKPTSSSMKESSNQTRTHYSGNPHKPTCCCFSATVYMGSQRVDPTWLVLTVTQTGLWWNDMIMIWYDYTEGTFESVDIFVTLVSRSVSEQLCSSHWTDCVIRFVHITKKKQQINQDKSKLMKSKFVKEIFICLFFIMSCNEMLHNGKKFLLSSCVLDFSFTAHAQ